MDTYPQGKSITLQATFYDNNGNGRVQSNTTFALEYLSQGTNQFYWYDWVNSQWIDTRNSDCELSSDNAENGGYVVSLKESFTSNLQTGLYKWEFTIPANSPDPIDKKSGVFEISLAGSSQSETPFDGTGLNFVNIQNEVCKRCFKDTLTFRSMVKNWINEAQQKLCAVSSGRWWWLETSAVIEINATDTETNLPTNFFELVDVSAVKDITNDIILTPQTHKNFEQTTTNGQPTKYNVYSKNSQGRRIIRFDVPSDNTRSIRIDYYKALPDLVNDEDISEIPYWYQYMLIEFAVARGHEHRQQSEMATLARRTWLEGISQLMIEADQKNNYQPRLRPKWRR